MQKDSFLDTYGLTPSKNIYSQPISDILLIPQSSAALSSQFSNAGKSSFAEYFAAHFAPWDNLQPFDLENLQIELKKRGRFYAENYQPISDEFYRATEDNGNISALNSVSHKAIVIHNTHLRRLPTNTLLLSDPYKAGGNGYPFDRAQAGCLNIGEPLFISHYTKDGKFAYGRTGSGTYGFILSEDLVEIDEDFSTQFRNNLVMFTDNILAPLQPAKQSPVLQVYSGTILPLTNNNEVLIPIRNSSGKAEFSKIYPTPGTYIAKPLSFTKDNVSKVIDQLIDKPYGWGGNLFNMDCSRLVSRYFALFGIHLPPYSKAQSEYGESLDLSRLSNHEKKAAIIEYGVPYQSILYMPGHIGIYLGTYQGEPIILHATWGIKLFDEKDIEYRYVIGKSIISTLHVGGNLLGFNTEKSDYLKKTAVISNLLR